VFQFSIHSFFLKATFTWNFLFKAQLIFKFGACDLLGLATNLAHEVMQFLFLYHFGFSVYFILFYFIFPQFFFTYFLEIYDLKFTYLDLGAWTSFEAWILVGV